MFTALFNGIDYSWIKVISDALIDTVEFMSAMGSSSQNLVLYATKSSSPYIPLIFTISKFDGSITMTFKIDDPTNIGNVNPPSKQSYEFQLMSARSSTEVYLCVNSPDAT